MACSIGTTITVYYQSENIYLYICLHFHVPYSFKLPCKRPPNYHCINLVLSFKFQFIVTNFDLHPQVTLCREDCKIQILLS